MGNIKKTCFADINKSFIILSFLVLIIPAGLLATPPQIDPDGAWDSLSYCINSAFVESLEVIDIDGDFITVSSSIGQAFMVNFYNDAENVSHWFGYIEFDIIGDCGEVSETSLVVTAVDNQSDSSSQTYGPFTYLGRLGVSMHPDLYIWPGEQEWMPVYIDAAECFCLGGFVLSIEYDTSVLTVTDARLGDKLEGNQLNFITYTEPYGPGTYKFLFLIDSDTNVCAIESDEPILEIKFLLSDEMEYPINFVTPVCFRLEEPYHESNMISDNTGYGLWWPYGCDYGGLQLDTECGNIKVLNEHNVLIGDINLNGFPFEVGDIVLGHDAVLDILSFPLSTRQRLAGDVTGNGLSLTIADLLYFCYVINGADLPDYPHNPQADTLKIESATVAPGDQLALPIYLVTDDTIIDFQAYLVYDPDYITLDSVVLNDMFPLELTMVSGFPHILSFTMDECLGSEPELFNPGAYHIGDFFGQVNPDIEENVLTAIEFQADPEYLAYSGLANGDFFEPVFENADILILAGGGFAYLPGDINMYNGAWPPERIGGDATYLVSYFRGLSSAQPCRLAGFWASADVNGDCAVIGSDVTRMVNYFRGQTSLLFCQDYPPLWQTTEDLPAEAPDSWPNCESEGVSGVIMPAGSDF